MFAEQRKAAGLSPRKCPTPVSRRVHGAAAPRPSDGVSGEVDRRDALPADKRSCCRRFATWSRDLCPPTILIALPRARGGPAGAECEARHQWSNATSIAQPSKMRNSAAGLWCLRKPLSKSQPSAHTHNRATSDSHHGGAMTVPHTCASMSGAPRLKRPRVLCAMMRNACASWCAWSTDDLQRPRSDPSLRAGSRLQKAEIPSHRHRDEEEEGGQDRQRADADEHGQRLVWSARDHPTARPPDLGPPMHAPQCQPPRSLGRCPANTVRSEALATASSRFPHSRPISLTPPSDPLAAWQQSPTSCGG